ncbi:hypothetical protein ASA1KI_40210 [Opitutales bacterium ASA1]|uniref:transglutaminase family protein n=1 Tax=Congregicoccus parvus TaxID=3081749 RepID=UPI002B2C5A69|nr:hypothetical protein ASA1KI_40210 [Opitutales bacterium ASA1]
MPRARRAPVDRMEAAVRRCAAVVEDKLRAADASLTMGGEPTFVPLVPNGPEWSVDALGPTKLGYARRLAARLLARVPAGALILETSGKHYPGEPIPRWSLHVQWRTDGVPLWRDSGLLWSEASEAAPKRPRGLRAARGLLVALARKLGASTSGITALTEPDDARTELAGGFALPLDHDGTRWISDRWLGAGERAAGRTELRLLVGDSWAGLRLPLATLREGALKRAIVVESRGGRLVVFLPPLLFDAYAQLVAAIEDTVRDQGCGPVVLTGYLPTSDARWRSFGVAADPGVIEANLPPAPDWAGYREWVVKAAEAAAEVGLCMRKLQFNGRALGSGGGAHLCFGGPTVDESPFLLRYDLLPSVLRFWQHHPALAYLFTGQFVGPSCQAPRVDETLPDALGQLDLACQGMRTLAPPGERFMLQGLFRDLLTDRAGNTHRAEISIDKLWNAGASNGMLGLLEFRAFETHPDPEVMARTGLLVRALLAALMERPFGAPFRDWGRRLHDEFFLPSLLWRDLETVVAWLREAGVPFETEWLRPVWDFRFPEVGRLEVEGGAIVLRPALEPWPMLAEQPDGGATSRAVDSSLERLEVSVPEMLAEQGALLVNGVRVPLRRAADANAGPAPALAGVRFKAFYLMTGLHPHIRAHAPLAFEWIGRTSGRVEAAARWHPWHPDGGVYPGLPADEEEARERARARWTPLASAVGARRPVPRVPRGAVDCFTLDLRRCPHAEPPP